MLYELKNLHNLGVKNWQQEFLKNIPNELYTRVKNTDILGVELYKVKKNEVSIIKIKLSGFWNRLFNKYEYYPKLNGFALEVWNRCIELNLDPILDYSYLDKDICLGALILISWSEGLKSTYDK